jgi:hypothetical protein
MTLFLTMGDHLTPILGFVVGYFKRRNGKSIAVCINNILTYFGKPPGKSRNMG